MATHQRDRANKVDAGRLGGSQAMQSDNHYNKKLLEPGWAGLLDLGEAKYIQAHLMKSQSLGRKWGIRGKRPALTTIARKALPENPGVAIENLVRQQRAAARLKNLLKQQNVTLPRS